MGKCVVSTLNVLAELKEDYWLVAGWSVGRLVVVEARRLLLKKSRGDRRRALRECTVVVAKVAAAGYRPLSRVEEGGWSNN